MGGCQDSYKFHVASFSDAQTAVIHRLQEVLASINLMRSYGLESVMSHVFLVPFPGNS